jgi:hypothetical protein
MVKFREEAERVVAFVSGKGKSKVIPVFKYELNAMYAMTMYGGVNV